MKDIRHHLAQRQARRCASLLRRISRHTFRGPLDLEDDHPCLVEAVFCNSNQLRIEVSSMLRLDWTEHAILWPSIESDFAGHLPLWEGRHYKAGVDLLRGEHLCLRTFFRPMHLHSDIVLEVAP
jgi:hypothetical protein